MNLPVSMNLTVQPMSGPLTHLNERGEARMVDV